MRTRLHGPVGAPTGLPPPSPPLQAAAKGAGPPRRRTLDIAPRESPHGLDRRSFLGSAAASFAAAALGTGCAQHEPARKPDAAIDPRRDARSPRHFDISLAQWSLHRSLQGRAEPVLDPLDFAATARRLGLDAVEYVNTFYKDKAQDAAYLRQLKQRAADAGVRSLLIMCDGEGALGDPDGARRTKAVENHYKWVEAAAQLGCHSIRVNAQSAGSYEEQRRLAADGLRRLTEYAAGHGLHVLVENHGGLSSNGAWLASVIVAVDHERCGTLPDFGNFDLGGGETYDRYRGVRELMPFAKAVSAKSHAFDADGNETHTDYRRMLDIVLDAGYRGYVGIEYEGDQLSETDGILATKALLERVRAELA